MVAIQWIARHLRIGVHNRTVVCFERFSEEERHRIYASSDDAARMYLYTLDSLLDHGWSVESLFFFAKGKQRCRIHLDHEYRIVLGDQSISFTLNRYGQMQLRQWLLEVCEK